MFSYAHNFTIYTYLKVVTTMKNYKPTLRTLVHHPTTLALALVSTMVMFMLTYNTVIRYGFSWPILLNVIKIYPLAVIFIYCLRTYVTLPLVIRLHHYFPQAISNKIPRHITVPLLVITGNVSIMMAILTETHRQLYPLFLPGYIDNWAKTFFVAIPLFFFIVRPAIIYIFNHLKLRFPKVD